MHDLTPAAWHRGKAAHLDGMDIATECPIETVRIKLSRLDERLAELPFHDPVAVNAGLHVPLRCSRLRFIEAGQRRNAALDLQLRIACRHVWKIRRIGRLR